MDFLKRCYVHLLLRRTFSETCAQKCLFKSVSDLLDSEGLFYARWAVWSRFMLCFLSSFCFVYALQLFADCLPFEMKWNVLRTVKLHRASHLQGGEWIMTDFYFFFIFEWTVPLTDWCLLGTCDVFFFLGGGGGGASACYCWCFFFWLCVCLCLCGLFGGGGGGVGGGGGGGGGGGSKAVQSLIVFHFFLLFTVRSGVKPTPTERGLWSCCVFAALLKDTSAWWTGALLTSSFSKSNHQSLILFLVLENAFLLKLQWSHFLCHHISPWAVSRHLANQITCKWMLLKPSPLFTLASVRLLQLLSLMLNTLGWADVVLTSPPEIREELSFLPVCKATPTVPAGCLPLALCPVWWMPRPQC